MAVWIFDANGGSQLIDPEYLQAHLENGWTVEHPNEIAAKEAAANSEEETEEEAEEEELGQEAEGLSLAEMTDDQVKDQARELGLRIGNKSRDTLIAEIETHQE